MTVSRWQLSDQEWQALREFQLTPGEARAFVKLQAAGPECVPHDALHVDMACRAVMITNMRIKLESRGFRILNVRGVGYRLTEVSKVAA